MINIVWAVLLISSLVYSFFCGNIGEVSDALIKSCGDCVHFIFTTGSVMVMWSGVMNIAEKSGLTKKITVILDPLITKIFNGLKRKSIETELVAANMTANILGLSNAATPLGIRAMKKLSEKSKDCVATDNMCMLAVINCASLQLIPSTLIAMRSGAGSESPGDIVVPIWICSTLTLIFAIIITKICERRCRFV